MHWFEIYAIVGAIAVLITAVRPGFDLSKRKTTVLLSNGDRVEKESRNVLEALMLALFAFFFWWVIIVFALIFVPIHDFLAHRSYMNSMVKDSTLWVPPDLRDEVLRRRQKL